MMTTQPLHEIKAQKMGRPAIVPSAPAPIIECRFVPRACIVVREIGRSHRLDIMQLVRAENVKTKEQTVYFADEYAGFPVCQEGGAR